VAANLPHNDAVRIEQTDGQEDLVVSALSTTTKVMPHGPR
jgi:hypothetical protein